MQRDITKDLFAVIFQHIEGAQHPQQQTALLSGPKRWISPQCPQRGQLDGVPALRASRLALAVAHLTPDLPGGFRGDSGSLGDLAQRRFRMLRDDVGGDPAPLGGVRWTRATVTAEPAFQLIIFRT